MIRLNCISIGWLLLLCLPFQGLAQEPHSGHSPATGTAKAPKLFLDKSPKVIEYQLKRLSNAELLLAERATDHKKYIPVYAAIVSRAGIPSGERRAAAEALAKLKSSTVIAELMVALESLTEESSETSRSAKDLLTALLGEDSASLKDNAPLLAGALKSSSIWARRSAATALLTAGEAAVVRQSANTSAEVAIDMLVAVGWLSSQELRDQLRNEVIAYLDAQQPLDVRRQAIKTLAFIASDRAQSYGLLVPMVEDAQLQPDAIHSLLTIPATSRNAELSQRLLVTLMKLVEATPIDLRTGDAFLDAAQLAESLLPALDAAQAREIGKRLRDLAVRVVRVRTVEDEMRYDVKYFAIEAGRPVEIILKNEDLMPHNLVITAPGSLKEVAFAAAKMAPDEVPRGKQYVPPGDKVLWATGMVAAGKQERLAFEAPREPGEYPFVCTFPNHWMRMYGVMVVVPDLDAWHKSPKPPADPIGNNRSFVKKWTIGDLTPAIETGLRGRSAQIGAKLLTEATCLQCHKMRGQGAVVGPDLTDVASRFKGDARMVLHEIVDPSHKVDPKYAVQQVLLADGKVYNGIVVEEAKDFIALISSPDQAQPLKISRDDIEELNRSSKSIMPTGLLDQYTQDEIFEILAYLMAGQ